MPHLRIEYSPHLEAQGDLPGLCDKLLRALLALRGADGLPVFPALGTRVLAYRADYAAVGPDGTGRDFVYVNMRITPGRDAATEQAAGEAVMAVLE
jgi:5-carboxymethyl-2-hydroxymuconate isomerase